MDSGTKCLSWIPAPFPSSCQLEYITYLRFIFLIYKINIMPVATSYGFLWGLNKLAHTNNFELSVHPISILDIGINTDESPPDTTTK